MADPRKQILALVANRKPVPLVVTPDGWPQGLCLAKPSLRTRDEITDYLKSGPNGGHPPDALAFILVRLVVDANGSRLFEDEDATAVAELTYEPAYQALAAQAIGLVAGVELDDEGNAKNR